MYIKVINENIVINPNYGIHNYLRWLQKAAKGCSVKRLRRSSQQWQAAINFDVSPYFSSEGKKSKPIFTNHPQRVREPFRSTSYTVGGCDSSDLHRRSKGISYPVGDLYRHFTKLTRPSAYTLHSNLIPPDGKNGLL